MNYKIYNDYELIDMVRENYELSLDLMTSKYDPIIKKLSKEYYLSFSNYGAEYNDFYQEALLAFISSINKFDESNDCTFYTFVILCIRRKLISFCRRLSCKTKNVSLTLLDDIDECPIVDDSVEIEKLVSYSEMEKLLNKFIFDLSSNYSYIFELRLNSFSYKEISILLDIPVSTVEYRFRKTRKKLEIYLKEKGFLY